MGTKRDVGDGMTIESEGYFAKDVALGDEAFCTKSDMIGYAGVLVRKGSSLTYVSINGGKLSGTSDPSVTDIEAELGNDDQKCDLAMKLAERTK